MKTPFYLTIAGICMSVWACQPSTEKSPVFHDFTSRYIVHATSKEGTVVATTVAKQLDIPWDIVLESEQYLWFNEQRGTVNRLNLITGHYKTFLQLPDVHYQKSRGLLGMDLHPNFPQEPYVYLHYTYYQPDSSIVSKLVRYTMEGDTLVNPDIFVKDIPGTTYHNGSRVETTSDGYVYLSTGDAGDPPASQRPETLTGKVLRFHLDGSIPETNPINGNPAYSWGHRNIQGLDKAGNGMMYASEHGPHNDDEINIIRKGHNYGWPDVQGFCDTPEEQAYCADSEITGSLTSWTPTIAPAGIVHYNHEAIPFWNNSLILVAMKDRTVRVMPLNPEGDRITAIYKYFPNIFGRMRDIATAADGSVYLSTSNRDWHPERFPARYPDYPREFDDRIIKLSLATEQEKSFIAQMDTSAIDILEEVRYRDLATWKAPGVSGKTLYEKNCMTCHMANGEGLPGFAPPIAQTVFVKNKYQLLQVMLHGMSGRIIVKGEEWDRHMPSFAFLSDEQIAKIATYVHREFGNSRDSVMIKDVQEIRN